MIRNITSQRIALYSLFLSYSKTQIARASLPSSASSYLTEFSTADVSRLRRSSQLSQGNDKTSPRCNAISFFRLEIRTVTRVSSLPSARRSSLFSLLLISPFAAGIPFVTVSTIRRIVVVSIFECTVQLLFRSIFPISVIRYFSRSSFLFPMEEFFFLNFIFCILSASNLFFPDRFFTQ